MSSNTQTMDVRLLAYYQPETLMQYAPAVARLDGRGFSKFTRGFDKPYDEAFGKAMRETAKYLTEKYHATFIHTQSDEITILFDYSNTLQNNMLFKGKVDKINSVLASDASVKFAQQLHIHSDKFDLLKVENMPHFDCRIASYPNAQEATNVFLWRYQDCVRNSVQMLARAHYSHSQCQNKSTRDLLTMLDEDGINWADMPDHFREGLYYRRRQVPMHVTGTEPVLRNKTAEICYTKFNGIVNRVDVVFNDADPERNTQ